MYVSSVTALALFAAFVAGKKCINQTVPVTITARQPRFNAAIPQTSLEVQDFILNMTQQGRNFTDIILEGYGDVSGTYNVSTQFCTPDNSNATVPAVQVLTHGIGFDKTYWDLSYNNFNYSYLDYATDKYGFCTLSFDRLGIANSSHGEALNEIQAQLEVEATVALTKMLRAGTFPMVNHTFTRVVHAGHSFGSAQTYLIAAQYPNITDGIILTGFSMNSSFVSSFAAGGNFQLAAENQPLRFANITGIEVQNVLSMYAGSALDVIAPIDLTALPKSYMLPPGYMITSNAEANKYQFLKPHFYDPAILDVVERTKQPVTQGELLSLGALPMMNMFSKPVMVITGSADLPYCGSDCLATGGAAASIPAQVQKNFPNVANGSFVAQVHPNSGHGINFHYNQTGAYDAMNVFFSRMGLGPKFR